MTTSDPAPSTPAPSGTPGVVTLVAILALITGLFCLLAGVLLIAGGIGDPAALGQSTVVLVLQGAVYLVLGFAALAVFKALRNGAHWARLLFTVVLVLAALTDLLNIVLGLNVSGSVWGIVLDLVCLYLLWGVKASRDFFDARRT